jgi:uncharacterized membrane protein YcaP (DUF421 family)
MLGDRMMAYMKLELSLLFILIASIIAGAVFQSAIACVLFLAFFILFTLLLFSRVNEKTKSILAFFAGIILLILIGAYGGKH